MYMNPKSVVKSSNGNIMNMTGITVTDNQPVTVYNKDRTSEMGDLVKATGKVAPANPHIEAQK